MGTKGTTLSTSTKINTLYFAEYQVIIADSDDNAQRGVFTLQNIAKNFGMEILSGKSKTMEFLRQDPIRCKIVVDNKCLQQVNSFKCLGCETFYENKKDFQQKVTKFSEILGILNNTFKPNLVQKFSRIKV